jgi:RNA polymerase sigma factor (sigma-70 family)
MNKTWTESQIIAGFKSNEADRQAAFRAFYTYAGLRASTYKQLLNLGVPHEELSDVFQDAMIVAERHLRAGTFKGNSKLTTWFIGIAKFTWLAKLQKEDRRNGLLPIDLPVDEFINPELMFLDEERNAVLDEVLTSIGDFCKQLLRYYGLHYSMKEIAELLNLDDDERAKDRARDCREKLRKTILENPILTELFLKK